ncbi:TonB-dependent siderophore receptor [Phenylobacterium sp.]|uniref:TonB-dependent receptor plug domain-containing protein n=1 Tax=Phenylobacterium sp. TaxID=1871053 RepID=UPI002734B99A|nr:TonB-dependent receptor [Phenylobacterium sp.]MDP3854916.1 TonB-dependent receptor [Phenylobacterium sp.]
MNPAGVIAAAALAATILPTLAAAQDAPAASGVIAYPPAFFAEMGTSTALDMVQRLPGFAFDKGATVRGLAGAGGNVLIDGEPPVSKNDTLEEVLKRIPVGSVLRIDVIRGGAPGIDMQGKTVLANVVRKQSAGTRGAISVSSQPLGDGRVLNALRAEGQWRWDGKLAELSMVHGKGADDSYGDGPRVRYGPAGVPIIRSIVDADAQGERRWLIGAFETPLAKGRLRVNGAYMDNVSDVELYDRLSFPTATREDERISNDRLQAELGGRFTRRFGATSLEAVAFQQWNNVDTQARFTSAAVNRLFASDKKVTETVGRLHLRRRWSEALSLEAGVEGAFNGLDSETSLSANGARVTVPAANVRVEEKRAEAFGVATWRPTPELTVEAAVRQETSTITSTGDVRLEKSLSFTKPRLAVTWARDAASQVRLRLEREVSQLNFDDFVASSSVASTGVVLAGNPDLSPQQAWVAEAAFERRFWTSGAVVLTLRHWELTEVIDRAPIGAGVVVADGPANIGEGTKDEAVVSLAVPLARFGVKNATFRGQLAWRDSQVVDPTTGRSREISGYNPVVWDAHLTQDLPQWKATWGVDVSGGFRETFYRLTEIETRKFETFATVFAELKPRSDIVLRVEVQNIGARDVQRIREVHAGPRSTAAIAYTDVRDLEWGRALFLRLRKTIG